MTVRPLFPVTFVAPAAVPAGCALFNHSGLDSPHASTSVAPFEPPPRTALVPSSGGPRNDPVENARGRLTEADTLQAAAE